LLVVAAEAVEPVDKAEPEHKLVELQVLGLAVKAALVVLMEAAEEAAAAVIHLVVPADRLLPRIIQVVQVRMGNQLVDL
jgi:hypothetical protein